MVKRLKDMHFSVHLAGIKYATWTDIGSLTSFSRNDAYLLLVDESFDNGQSAKTRQDAADESKVDSRPSRVVFHTRSQEWERRANVADPIASGQCTPACARAHLQAPFFPDLRQGFLADAPGSFANVTSFPSLHPRPGCSHIAHRRSGSPRNAMMMTTTASTCIRRVGCTLAFLHEWLA